MSVGKQVPDRTTRVVVAEPSQMECQLLVDVLERQCRFELIGSYTTSAAVMSAIRDAEPDVALVSARLQDGIGAGLTALRRMRACEMRSRVVILLDSEERDMVVECFRNGARGVFNRTGSPKQLCKCVTSVCQGQIWASNTAMKYLVEALARPPILGAFNPRSVEVLSTREQEVTRLVVAGSSNREIAESLNLHEHTIRNYLSHIFKKLAVSSRTELVLRCLAQNTAADEESVSSASKFGT
jgi:two-component system, NarL family, nitrate/nitrite response regulator NarL